LCIIDNFSSIGDGRPKRPPKGAYRTGADLSITLEQSPLRDRILQVDIKIGIAVLIVIFFFLILQQNKIYTIICSKSKTTSQQEH
jgi:hypothetical protein